MLDSLFSKTRPIGYIIIAIFLLLFYGINLLSENAYWITDSVEIMKKIILFIVMVASVFLVQFVSQKNQMSTTNLYSLFFYSCFLLLFSSYFDSENIIIANFFVLLGFKNIFSIHSMQMPRQKIFNASMCFLIASLFDSWVILFLPMVYITIIFYVSEDYRHWIIPLVSAFVVLVLFYAYGLMVNLDFVSYWQEKFKVSFQFNYFENDLQRVALSVFVALCSLFIANKALLVKKIVTNQQNFYKSILMCFGIGAAVFLISNPKYNASLVYTFFPLSFSAGNFMANTENKWVKQLTMIGVLLVSVLIFIFQI